MPVLLLKRTVSFCALFGTSCANYKQEMICVTFENGSDGAARVDFFNHVFFESFVSGKSSFCTLFFMIRFFFFQDSYKRVLSG